MVQFTCRQFHVQVKCKLENKQRIQKGSFEKKEQKKQRKQKKETDDIYHDSDPLEIKSEVFHDPGKATVILAEFGLIMSDIL
jgi:hypothetical protein